MTRDPDRRAADAIEAAAEAITDRVIDLDYGDRGTDLKARYGARGEQFYRRDNAYHLRHLAESVAYDDASIFIDYVAWAKSMLLAYGVAEQDLRINLTLLSSALSEVLPPETAARACDHVDRARTALEGLPEAQPSFLSGDDPQGDLAGRYLDALLATDRHAAGRLIEAAVRDGVDIRDIYLDVFEPTQREIGRLWQMNAITVAQEHFCSAVTQTLIARLFPTVATLATPATRRFVAVCVADELHDIGLRIVSDFFELEGWDTHYLGANTPTRSIISMLNAVKADLLGLSVTIPYHLGQAAEIIAAVRATPELETVRILVGGRPFLLSPDLWQRLGADGMARNARDALAVADRLVPDREADA